jgi:hypothetical protein
MTVSETEKSYVQKRANKLRRANQKAGISFQKKCVECGEDFTTFSEDTKYCSSRCVGRVTARIQVTLKKTVTCSDCGVTFEVPLRSTRTTRCPEHMAAWRAWYADRRNTSLRNKKRAVDGEGPWSDWVVFGPTYDFELMQWVVNLAHKRAANKRALTQAEYLMSVHLGRKLVSGESVTFIDGNSDNLDISNLQVVKSEK